MRRLLGLLVVALTISGPARADVCTPGPFIIFFAPGTGQLDRDGRKTLDNALDQVGNCGPDRIMLAGFTDTKESPAWARERVKVVRAYFAAHGFPRRYISAQVFGPVRQRIATAENVSERQNRRVEITVGPR